MATPVYSSSAGGRRTVRADFARRWSELLQRRGRLLVQNIAVTLGNEMSSGGRYSPGTPIDKGFHRAAWVNELNGIPALPELVRPGKDEDFHAAAEAARARMEERSLGVQVGDSVTYANNAPGIRRLEFDGWSTQAPDGFVRPAARALQQIVDEVGEYLEARGGASRLKAGS